MADQKPDESTSRPAPTAPAVPAPVVPPTLSRFGPAAIDFAINRHLEATIPAEKRRAVLDVKLVGKDGERVLSGIVAVRGDGGWGAAVGGAIDLNDRDDFVAEVMVTGSF